MKKPLLQRKWVWVVGILLIAVGVFEIKTQFGKANEEKARIEATENADKVLKGKVEVPDPYFKSKDEVEKLFEQAGLKADFVVTNFDEKATLNKKNIKVGDCDQLDPEQPNVKYYDTDEVGDRYGFYADKGATIIVGYTDHDFNGKEKDTDISSTTEDVVESSSAVESSTVESSSVVNTAETVESSSTEGDGDITKLSSEPTSKQQTTLRVLGKQAFEQQYPYKGSKMHSIMGIIQDWTQKGDVWFFKCEATIVNEYGAELETVVEITIEPTGPESGNVTVLHY